MNKSEDRDIGIIKRSWKLVVNEKKDKAISKSYRNWKDYSDFELEITKGTGQDYSVALIHSPAGEVHGIMHFPFNELELNNALKDIQIALLEPIEGKRQIVPYEEKTIREFGKKLFDALITGEIQSCYNVSLREAAQKDMGLRIKLRIKPPELSSLPWEFLFDPHHGDYISLCNNTPIVRYLELPQSISPLAIDPPLRILGMVSSPDDRIPLDINLEKQRIEEALSTLKEQGLVDITWLPGQTWEDLQQAMRTGTWHVFHFIGHGGYDRNADEGLIALADSGGQSCLLTATQLGRFLAGHNSLKLVLLNSCEGAKGGTRDIFSSTASILVRRGIPAVLAMQYKITDRAAIGFARSFYLALADGMPVDVAVAEARIALSVSLTNTLEWGTPVLYMRSPDGVLFKIKKRSISSIFRKRKQKEEKKETQTKANYCTECGHHTENEMIYCTQCGNLL